MIYTERIRNLIAYRLLYGEDRNEAERLELQEWLEASDENRAVYEQLMDTQNWQAWKEKREAIHFEKYWNNVARQTIYISRRTIRHRILMMVASVTLLFGIGTAVWFYSRNNIETVNPAALITPGESKACLVFSDGKSVTLDSKVSYRHLEKDGVLISADSVGLTYVPEKIDRSNVLRHTLIVPKGGEYILTLEDGTMVQVNAQSTLEYPVHFTGDKREVFLEGEAFFRVQHADNLPFIVRTRSMDIQVTGTEFNVRAYHEEPFIQTTLVKGQVNVVTDGIKNELVPDQQAELDLSTRQTKIREVDVDEFIAWTNGWFIFKGQRLEDIMQELARWYDFEVFYQNPEVREMVFGGKLDRTGSIEPILKIIEATLTVHIEIKGKTIVFRSK